MSRELSINAETLVKAALLFCQKTYQTFPGSVVEAVDDHYSDEDLTFEIRVPAELDKQQVADELIRIALSVEDVYGATIVTRAVSAHMPYTAITRLSSNTSCLLTRHQRMMRSA